MSTMDARLDESKTENQDIDYSAWIRAGLPRRMQTPQRKIPHEHVMAELDALIQAGRQPE